jgi:hypothetical protein
MLNEGSYEDSTKQTRERKRASAVHHTLAYCIHYAPATSNAPAADSIQYISQLQPTNKNPILPTLCMSC